MNAVHHVSGRPALFVDAEHPDGSKGMCFQHDRVVVAPLDDPTPDGLDTIVHEVLHLALTRLYERQVKKASRAISSVLWLHNWRNASYPRPGQR
jgi:hypothetical protein